jgi:hypothetical protein
MIIFDDFDGYNPKAGPHCMACEAMLTDAVDETLGAVDKAWFDQHIAGCVRCAERFADAQRGSAWLEMLKSSRPEPAGDLVARIMAETTGRAEIPVVGVQVPVRVQAQPFLTPFGTMSVPVTTNLIPFRPVRQVGPTGIRGIGRMLLEPRLAMTAAMAFFSIALTMNLTGVHLNELHASSLKPANLQRSYFQASTRAVQYYDSLRVVHVLESRVDDLRQATEEREQERRTPTQSVPKSEPGTEQKEQNKTEPGPGTSKRETPGKQPFLLVADDRASSVPTSKPLMAAVWQMNLAGGRS